jgi:hypothetical protein
MFLSCACFCTFFHFAPSHTLFCRAALILLPTSLIATLTSASRKLYHHELNGTPLSGSGSPVEHMFASANAAAAAAASGTVPEMKTLIALKHQSWS